MGRRARGEPPVCAGPRVGWSRGLSRWRAPGRAGRASRVPLRPHGAGAVAEGVGAPRVPGSLPRALLGHLPPLRCPGHPPSHPLPAATDLWAPPSGNLRPCELRYGSQPCCPLRAFFIWGVMALTGALGVASRVIDLAAMAISNKDP